MIIPIRILIICKNKLEIRSLVEALEKERYNPFIQIVDKEEDVVFLLDNYQWDIIFIDYNSLNEYHITIDSQIDWINQIQKTNPFSSILIAFDNFNQDKMENFISKTKFKHFNWDKLNDILPYIKTEIILSNLKKQRIQKNKFYLYQNDNDDDQDKNNNYRGLMDIYDQLITKYLYLDGRSTLTSIAKSIKLRKNKNISHVFVKRRIERLLEKDIIKIQSNLNLEKFGYYLAVFLIQTENKEFCQRLVEKYSECPRNIFSMEVYGKYDLLLIYFAQNLEILESIMDFCSPKHCEGVKKIETLISTSISIPKYFPFPIYLEEKCEECVFAVQNTVKALKKI